LNNPNLKAVTIDGNRLGFFFGAGASVEFGIPSMKNITELFKSKINKDNKNKEKHLFNSIYNSLEQIYGKSKVDLESIMSVIVGLKEISALDSIGDLGLFLLQQKGIKDISDIK